MLFKIEGPVASPYQFYITDGKSHFLRGSLYFDQKVNFDSLRPVIEFLKTDIEHLMASVKWAE
jgi:gliding motility-associated lipoprotein GldD